MTERPPEVLRDLDFFHRMQLIRRAEEKIRQHYFDDEMKTPVHLSIGQEAVAVGVIGALDPADSILGTYRSHAIYLARTLETANFFAELHGRGTAWAKGKAGSMHLAAPAHGVLVTSAVVGTTIPVALGVAFSNQRAKNQRMTAVFFGDGAIDEGAFWESLNYACLAKLPLLFVCEDNDLAIHAKASDRHGYDSISAIAERFRCHAVTSDSTDPAEIQRLTQEAITQHHETGRPAFLHLKCYRYLEHVGVSEDFEAGYRAREEFEGWLARDPIALVRERLIGRGVEGVELTEIEDRIDAELEASLQAALAAPFAKPEQLWQDVFA